MLTKRPQAAWVGSYVHDLSNAWSTLPDAYHRSDRVVVWCPKDRVERFGLPVLVKTRIGETDPCASTSAASNVAQCGLGSILFKLNSRRHFAPMLDMQHVPPTPWSRKRACVVWRGKATGYGFGNNIPPRGASRETLVRRWQHAGSPLVDVGLVGMASPSPIFSSSKPTLTMADMCAYRYILSVEGNDVATNLKWIMASDSVLFMPRPHITSWFMEDRLQPWVHYVPVRDDFEDLEARVRWAEAHPHVCQRIVANCHAWVAVFADEASERRLCAQLLQWYLDAFRWTETN